MKQKNTEKESSTRMIAAATIALLLAVMSAGIAGAFSVGVGELLQPGGVAVDASGNIYVADNENNLTKIFNSAGVLQPLQIGNLNSPTGVAVDTSGNIYVANTRNNTVDIFNSAGVHQSTIVGLDLPDGVAVGGPGNNIYVANTFNDTVKVFNQAGILQSTIAGLNSPGGVAVDSAGFIYVADSGNNLVKKFNLAGDLLLTITGNLLSPQGVAVDTQGNIHVANTGRHVIQKFNSTGIFVSEIGTINVPSAPDGQFDLPEGIAVGGTGIIYVGDTNNNRVQVIAATGVAGGNITGQVVTAGTLVPIVGATISVQGKQPVLTNAGGNYTLTNIAAGNVFVEVSKPGGFITVNATVTVVNGGTVTRDFILTPLVNGIIDGMVTDASPASAPLAGVSITVGNATIPSIITLTSNATGMFNVSIAAGNYNVTATKAGFTTTTAPVNVTAGEVSIVHITMLHVPVLTGVTVAPAAATIVVGRTQALIATPVDQLGIDFVGATIAWTSSNPAVATVHPTTGLVTGVDLGSATITANATNGTVFKINTSTITVEVPVLTSVSVSPATAILIKGGTRLLTPLPLDQTGAAFSGASFTWTSSNSSAASVNSSTGLVTGVDLGSATITVNATNGTVFKTGVSAISVEVPRLAGIEVTPGTVPLTTGGTKQLTAAPHDQTGAAFFANVTWNSNDPAVAAVNATGFVTAVAPGSATIIVNATSGAISVINTSSITVTAPPTTSSGGSSSGGGGGGGGGSSGEKTTNIDVIEKYDLQISKDVQTPYRFTHAKNPIRFVNITGNTSLGIITASIEVLKSTSTLVKMPPEGLTYMYMNIWVGTTGFANEKNIKKALIKFRVNNDWFESKGIPASEVKMMRWDGSKWITLETKLIEKEGTVTTFESETRNFSPFAITGKIPITEAKPLPVTTTPPAVPGATAPAAAIPTKGTPGFEVFAAIGVLGAIYILYRKRR